MIKFLLLASAFLAVMSLWGFYSSIRPPKIVSTITPEDMGLVYEQVTFMTKDGIALSGWFIPRKKSNVQNIGVQRKTVVLLHGYPADKGDILPALAFLNDEYDLFMFDFRYFGQSGGWYSTAGIKEKRDLAAAIAYLKTRGVNEVGVWGFSLGGAVVLASARETPEIKAVVSEASYARLDTMARELYLFPLLDRPLAVLTGLWAKIFLNVDIKEDAPVNMVKGLRIPVLIIHSTNDEVIPFDHALALKEALQDDPQAEFWFQEGLEHGEFNEEYRKKVAEFFLKNL